MPSRRRLFSYCLILALSVSTLIPKLVFAEDRSFYSPVIHIDKEQNQILISTSASVFYIEVPDCGKAPYRETSDFRPRGFRRRDARRG